MTMREVNLDQELDRLTVIAAGASRSGKTEFLATFPRPWIIADASEGGWQTIRHMDRNKLYEDDFTPRVLAVESASDMVAAIMKVEAIYNDPKTRHLVGTVGVDSLTFYGDTYVGELEPNPAYKDPRRLYGAVATHLRSLMLRVHKIPTNIVWTALDKEPGEDGGMGGILIAGQTATKAPARCDLWLYMTATPQGPGRPLLYEAHTQNYARFKAGHRFGNRLPEPMTPTYRALEQHLGLTSWLERHGLAKPVPPEEQQLVAAAVGAAAEPPARLRQPLPPRRTVVPAR
jgi:hypothetical protein